MAKVVISFSFCRKASEGSLTHLLADSSKVTINYGAGPGQTLPRYIVTLHYRGKGLRPLGYLKSWYISHSMMSSHLKGSGHCLMQVWAIACKRGSLGEVNNSVFSAYAQV